MEINLRHPVEVDIHRRAATYVQLRLSRRFPFQKSVLSDKPSYQRSHHGIERDHGLVGEKDHGEGQVEGGGIEVAHCISNLIPAGFRGRTTKVEKELAPCRQE